MTTVVTVTVYDHESTEVESAKVEAKLFQRDPLTDMFAGSASVTTATTDANGEADLTLWSNSSNTDIDSYYRFRAWHPTTKKKVLDVCAYLVGGNAYLEDRSFDCRTVDPSTLHVLYGD